MPTLSSAQIGRFIAEGFIRIDDAFERQVADEGRAILWKDTGCDPKNPSTWRQPVIRLGHYAQEPFRKAANAPILCSVYDDLVGSGRWQPPGTLGTFPVRFPSSADPGDTGWHVDSGFPGPQSGPDDYLSWRVNVCSRGRALLMLFLFSDVSRHDAPTRIAVGSHIEVAQLLARYADEGLSFTELAAALDSHPPGPEIWATGRAGTVYLCHPFLLHAAQRHRGTEPRFVAQPPLMPATPFQLHREDLEYSPVERSIRAAIGLHSRDIRRKESSNGWRNTVANQGPLF